MQTSIKTWRINRFFVDVVNSHRSNIEVLKIFDNNKILKSARQGASERIVTGIIS